MHDNICRLPALMSSVGIIGITPRRQLLKKGAEPVTDSQRMAALQLACGAVNDEAGTGLPGWLVPEIRGTRCWSGSQFARALRTELMEEAPDAMIFKVIGSDTAVRYPRELLDSTVVVCRHESTEALRWTIKERRLEQRHDLLLVDELPGEECSSTKVRKALESDDVTMVRNSCSNPVAEYLLSYHATCRNTPPKTRIGRH